MENNNTNIKAIIDIGSNSIKMRAGYINNVGQVVIVHDETEVVKLGRGVNSTGFLAEENMNTTLKALKRMVDTAKKLNAGILIAGTMALRLAKNSDEFLKRVHDLTGLDVRILSGVEEAEYSRSGAVEGIEGIDDVENSVVFDTGGGSTEFINGEGKIDSVPVGAVTLTERFFYDNDNPITRAAWDNAYAYVQKIINEHKIASFKKNSDTKIIGVGGGVSVMASVKSANELFLPLKLHGMHITQKDIIRQAKLYASLNLSERQKIVGLPAPRADVILGSACIVLCALRILDADYCTVSINGLRHGLLISECKK